MKYFNYDESENVVIYTANVATSNHPIDYDIIERELEIDWEDFWEETCDICNNFPLGVWEEEPKTIEEKIAFIEDIEKLEETKEFRRFIDKLDEQAQEEYNDYLETSYNDRYNYEEREEPDWDYLERTIWWDHE